jgi:hypothetical protein
VSSKCPPAPQLQPTLYAGIPPFKIINRDNNKRSLVFFSTCMWPIETYSILSPTTSACAQLIKPAQSQMKDDVKDPPTSPLLQHFNNHRIGTKQHLPRRNESTPRESPRLCSTSSIYAIISHRVEGKPLTAHRSPSHSPSPLPDRHLNGRRCSSEST